MGWLVATAWAMGVAGFAAWAAGPPPPPPGLPAPPTRGVQEPRPGNAVEGAPTEAAKPDPGGEEAGEPEEIPPPPGSVEGGAGGSEPATVVLDKPEYPYQRIITARNAFGLKPIPPPAPVAEPTNQVNVQPSALKLTGVITLLGAKHALFVVQEPGKPQLNSDLVKEGEKDGIITNLEVLHIDERGTNPSVQVVYGGKQLTLNFLENGLKPPAAPAAAPAMTPGVPGRTSPTVAGGPPPTPGAMGATTTVTPVASPVAIPSLTGSSGLRNIPVRPTRLGGGSSASLRASGGSGVYQVGGPVAATEPAIPPDQQALMMRAQEEIARRQGASFPPSPPGIGQMPGLPGAPTE